MAACIVAACVLLMDLRLRLAYRGLLCVLWQHGCYIVGLKNREEGGFLWVRLGQKHKRHELQVRFWH